MVLAVRAQVRRCVTVKCNFECPASFFVYEPIAFGRLRPSIDIIIHAQHLHLHPQTPPLRD